MGIIEGGDGPDISTGKTPCRYHGRDFKRPVGIDTSEWFNQKNYRGKILEAHLGEPSFTSPRLSDVFKEAKEKGYNLSQLMTINVIHGESKNNEPVEAIGLSLDNGLEGIIVIRRDPCEYQLYETEKKNFRVMLG